MSLPFVSGGCATGTPEATDPPVTERTATERTVTVAHLPVASEVAQPPQSSTGATDPVARLQERIDAGEVTLRFDPQHGYLPALLDALDIPVASQNLVFSRTSLQTDRIAPWSPRALYYNDEVYVGSVVESTFLEIASIDPELGAIFYTLPQEASEHPVFEHETTTCLMCHDSRTTTSGVNGLIMLSVLTDRNGRLVTGLQEGPTTDRTPLSERWGGWYVTGTHASMTHSGNTMAPLLSHEVSDTRRYLSEFDLTSGGNVTDLTGRFDLEPYLTEHSDIVSLMVLTHQVQVHNLITAAAQATQDALRDQDAALRSSGREAPEDGLLPTTRIRIEAAAERLVRTMLFAREAPLTGPVRGTSDFSTEFMSRGPSDSRGRSLRDLDLETRLMRYPLSFLIYSEAFAALPEITKGTAYRQIWKVLQSAAEGDEFSHLSPSDRSAILEILEETLPEFLEMRAGPHTGG